MGKISKDEVMQPRNRSAIPVCLSLIAVISLFIAGHDNVVQSVVSSSLSLIHI